MLHIFKAFKRERVVHSISRNIIVWLACLIPAFLFAQSVQNNSPRTVINLLPDTSRVLLYDSIANALMKTPDSAQHYVDEGLNLARKVNFKKGIALLLNDQAIVYMEKGNDDKALSEFAKSVAQFQALGLNTELGKTYKDMALVNLYKAEHEKAMRLVLKALNIFETNHIDIEIPTCYTIMGYIHVQQGDLKEGLKDHQKSYGLAEQLVQDKSPRSDADEVKITSYYVQSCRNLGNVYTRIGKYASSLEYLKKGLEYSTGKRFLSDRIKLLISTALVYTKLKDTKNAVSVLKEALSLSAANKMYYNQAVAYANLAALTGNSKIGLQYYDSAISLADERVNDVMLVVNILNEKSNYAKEKGNYQEALTATEKYHALNDSIFSVEKTVAIKNLESINQLHKSKVAVQQMQLRNLKNRQTIYIIGIIAFALVVALVITVVYQSKLKKLHKMVLLQNDELSELNKTKDKVFSVISHDLRSPLVAVSGILYLLKTDGLEPDEKEYFLSKLIRQHENALETMDKLLAWGSLEMRKELVKKTFIVREELKNTLQIIDEVAKEKNIAFHEAIDDHLQLTTNPYHFEFIIRNLLQNAVKFTPSGGNVNFTYHKETNNHVFSVVDSGTGIPTHIADKLYQSAVESTFGTGGEKGTGIGLFLVKKYADANRHQLEVSSIPDLGTSFFYKIPL